MCPKKPASRSTIRRLWLSTRGFALIGENLATIVSNDAVSSIDVKKERIEHMIERIEKKISTAAYPPDQQEHETRKVALLKTLLDSAGKSSS